MKVLFTFLKFKIHRTIVNQKVSPFFTWNKDFFGNYTRSKIAFVRVYTRHKRKQNSFPPLVRLRKYCQKRIWNWRFIPLASKLKTRFLGKTILNVYLYRVTMIEYVMCHSFEKKKTNEKMGISQHTSLYFPISTNCAETKRRDDADCRWYSDNDDALQYTGLCNHPGQS